MPLQLGDSSLRRASQRRRGDVGECRLRLTQMLVRGPLLHLRARRATCLRRRRAGGLLRRCRRWGRLLGPAADGQGEQRRCRNRCGPTRCRTFHCLAPPLSKSLKSLGNELSKRGATASSCWQLPAKCSRARREALGTGKQFLRAVIAAASAAASAHESAELFFDDPRPPALCAQRRLPQRRYAVVSIGSASRSSALSDRLDATRDPATPRYRTRTSPDRDPTGDD